MSATAGLLLALVTLGSCYASYCLGQRDILTRLRKMQEKSDRWAEWDVDNLEDFDE
ncbi:MAG: hypothetical protein ACO3GP_07175 [Candidatus Limnocylindrus sp.]|jgi:hypothetical protein